MSWRKVPLLQEEALLTCAVENLAAEMEWGLEIVESVEGGGGGGGLGTNWLNLQIDTDDALSLLCPL